nr:MAG TPA: hypothetical protein [Caudoviricetes sp.]
MHNVPPVSLVHLWFELTGYMCGLERICTYQKKRRQQP